MELELGIASVARDGDRVGLEDGARVGMDRGVARKGLEAALRWAKGGARMWRCGDK